MLYKQYYENVRQLMEQAVSRQEDKIVQAAEWLADSIASGGVIYVFGCGHSHMLAEELFYRAGGLACVSAILEEDIMLHKSAVRSSTMEKTEGITPAMIDRYGVQPGDVALVISTSGINPGPVDAALHLKKLGAKVICVTSSAYAEDKSRHSSGLRLFEAGDMWLDNCAPHGDASVTAEGCSVATGPVSTLSSTLLMECMVVEAVELLAQRGVQPPVFTSGNVPGGPEKNEDLIKHYRQRVRLLDPYMEV
ncbi:MAG: SIS domain-containing protein [Clostridia bacterium]|nr:SIS domain-containing protein [Clostridia bacterium]